jgi:hypothetical protein
MSDDIVHANELTETKLNKEGKQELFNMLVRSFEWENPDVPYKEALADAHDRLNAETPDVGLRDMIEQFEQVSRFTRTEESGTESDDGVLVEAMLTTRSRE